MVRYYERSVQTSGTEAQENGEINNLELSIQLDVNKELSLAAYHNLYPRQRSAEYVDFCLFFASVLRVLYYRMGIRHDGQIQRAERGTTES
ncbi:hypothetical protein GCM10008014_44940 [Paenibacillus silvae]|uniref:Uncharacterized protein n=1 Tax=Paenibacillus silvae TaxID=1325358 RepID=A0ABQ1ZGK3_9BACL|nr:hypothetical protein GCM10008014_44940 [Paenibacillus silvae]